MNMKKEAHPKGKTERLKNQNESTEKDTEWQNPIDKDKIAENPHLLPYAHTVGGAVIKPVDRGRIKGQAVMSMYEQADRQMDQIREQIELLAAQAQKIQDRVKVSEEIYQAEINFKPLVSHIYHLYKKKSGKHVLSMVGPAEWGKNAPYEFVATVKLLADHTWEIINEDAPL